MKTIGKLIIFIFSLLVLAASTYATEDSPLYEAVARLDKAAVAALLAKGADVNVKAGSGWTPLHRAVYRDNKDIVELLLAKGADVNAKLKDGVTPLHLGSEGNGQAKDMAELLLAKGADVNAKDENGNTPLHKAAEFENKVVAELLLAKGADVNAKSEWGDTPLHKAAVFKSKVLAELLLAKGANVTTKNKNGLTPLYIAVSFGRKDNVELLLANGADVNTKNKFDQTLLHELMIPDMTPEVRKDIAELLLAKGADVTAKSVVGETPLKWAEGSGRKDILELMEERILKQVRSNPGAALVQMTAQVKDKPDDKTGTRRLIIKLASELKPAPAIPEEARKHFVEGTAIVKAAKNPAQQALAAQSFTEALKVAPWWGDAYYNLGVAQELAEQYDAAEQAFNFYLLSDPSETEKREVQDRIYILAAKRKLSGAK